MVAYYLTFYYIHIPHHFQVPRFMLVTGTTFHVSYRHTIGPSAWVVDYIITQSIAALTIEGIHIHPQVTWLALLFCGKKLIPALLSEGLNIGLVLVNKMSTKRCVFSSVHFSCSVVSDSLRLHGPQPTRPPCPSTTPGVYSNSHPLTCVLILSRRFNGHHVFQPLSLSLSHKSELFQIGPPPSGWIQESNGRRLQSTYNWLENEK